MKADIHTPERTLCFYNADDNLWCEYKFDTLTGMFNYEIFSTEGYEYSGYVGTAVLKERAGPWKFLGVL